MKLTLPELSLVVLVGVSGSSGGQIVRASTGQLLTAFQLA